MPSKEPTLSSPSPAPTAPGQALAFLKEGDVWLAGVPDGSPIRLTNLGDVAAFAWSADGQEIVTSSGQRLCFFHDNGTAVTPCLELGADGFRSLERHRVIWSPDRQRIALWNVGLWDEDGWLLVSLGPPASKLHILDGARWGISIPGGEERPVYPGQPLFLVDDTLIGTLADQWFCGSGGCRQRVYRFDWQTQQFLPHPLDESSAYDGQGNLALSGDGRVLAAFDSFHVGCEYYVASVGIYDLDSGGEHSFRFDQETFHGMALSPQGRQAVMARSDGCAAEDETPWSEACGLYDSFEIYAMQLLDLGSGDRTDLVPGVNPGWSPSGDRIAFHSCLSQAAEGQWEATAMGPPRVFVMDPAGGQGSILAISDGSSAAWQPTSDQ